MRTLSLSLFAAACMETYGVCERTPEPIADVGDHDLGWAAEDASALLDTERTAQGTDGLGRPVPVRVVLTPGEGPVQVVRATVVSKRRLDRDWPNESLLFIDLQCHDEVVAPVRMRLTGGPFDLALAGVATLGDGGGLRSLQAHIGGSLPPDDPGLPAHADVVAEPQGVAEAAYTWTSLETDRTQGGVGWEGAEGDTMWYDEGLRF